MTAAPMNSANRFAHIDALRAYAVMVVVVAHAGAGAVIPGGSGVTIFFSISGFIITYLLLRERDRTQGFGIGGFYWRRMFKIAPPFVVAVIVPSLIWAISNPMDWRAFFAQVFFVFNWFKVDQIPQVLPGTGVVWSLSIEEQFYIVFALIWLFTVRRRHWQLITIVIASGAIAWSTLARMVLVADPSRIYYGSDTRLDGIAYGMLTAVCFHLWQTRGNRPNSLSRALGSNWALVVAIALYLATLVVRDEWFRGTFRFSLQSIATCLIIVYGLIPGDGLVRRAFTGLARSKPVEVLGLASYSIYLVHLTVIGFIAPSLAGLAVELRSLVQILVGTGVGIAMYYWLEKPAHRLRLKLDSRRRAGVEP